MSRARQYAEELVAAYERENVPPDYVVVNYEVAKWALALEALLESTKPYLWNGLGEPPHIWDLVEDAVAASGRQEEGA